MRAEVRNAGEFGSEIDLLFPVGDGVGDFRPDPFHAPEFVRFRQQNALGAAKNVQQTAQAHRPQLRNHVERDACLGFSHAPNANTGVKGNREKRVPA